jgi:hypothetical protein
MNAHEQIQLIRRLTEEFFRGDHELMCAAVKCHVELGTLLGEPGADEDNVCQLVRALYPQQVTPLGPAAPAAPAPKRDRMAKSEVEALGLPQQVKAAPAQKRDRMAKTEVEALRSAVLGLVMARGSEVTAAEVANQLGKPLAQCIGQLRYLAKHGSVTNCDGRYSIRTEGTP